MKAILLKILLSLACMATVHAKPKEVPDSRSPDGRWAVFYSVAGGDYTFSVCAVSGRPSFPLARTAAIEGDAKLMYETAGVALDRWFSDGGRGAEQCRLSWNANGTMLAMEAGAHKFGTFRVYRKSATGISEVSFPQNYESRLIDFAKAASPKIHEMGVNRFAAHKAVLTDLAQVNLLEGGYIAVSTYGAQCHRAFQELPEAIQEKITGAGLFFLFHLGEKGDAKFVGFCH